MTFLMIQTAWFNLQAKISIAKCLDDVILAHDSYLNEILGKLYIIYNIYYIATI